MNRGVSNISLTVLACLLGLLAPAWGEGVSLDPAATLFSARQLGLGGLSLCFSDDGSGVLANPSGLTGLEFPQVVAASRRLLLDQTQYILLGWAMPASWGTIGAAYTGLNTGGSLPTQRDPATGRIIIDPSREATSYDNSVFALSYARQVDEKLSAGGTLKFFNQSLSGGVGSRANATGLDLGATYRLTPWLTAAGNLQNLLEGNLIWEDGAADKVGGSYKLGCKVNILGSAEALSRHPQRLTAGLDVALPHSSLTGPAYHLGAEYYPLEKIALRGGLDLGPNGAGLALGVGLTNGGFRFDYAFVQRPGIPGDNPHYFSLCYVGERAVSHSYKLKTKESGIIWLEPKDRLVTDRTDIMLRAHVREKRILDEKTTWTVTAISETSEVKPVERFKELTTVYLNGIKLEQGASIETSSPLAMGRNIFELNGYSEPESYADRSSPEVFVATSEVRVLRFKPFIDTPLTHWAIEPIALAVTLGLVKGYPDNSFLPDRGITRAELVTLLVRTMPVKLAESVPYSGFKDVSNKHWAARYIAYGSYKNLITGYPDGTFQPNKVLTRAEGITVLARYSNLIEISGQAAPFPDLQANFWANKHIAAAQKAGMLKYLVGKNFEPSTPFSRAEACEVLYRTPPIQRGVDQFWNTGLISAQ